MKNKRKVLFIANVVCVASLLLSTSVFAENEIEDVQVHSAETQENDSVLRYTYIKQILTGCSISQDRLASVYSECETYEDADSISIVTELQRNDDNSWTTVKTFKESVSNKSFCSIDDDYYVTRNKEYRTKTKVTVKDNGVTETTTKYGSVQTCYSLSE